MALTYHLPFRSSPGRPLTPNSPTRTLAIALDPQLPPCVEEQPPVVHALGAREKEEGKRRVNAEGESGCPYPLIYGWPEEIVGV